MIAGARCHGCDVVDAEPIEGATLFDVDVPAEPLADFGHEIRTRRLADGDEERARRHAA